MFADNYSLILNPVTLANSGENIKVSADDAQRSLLAEELRIVSVKSLEIDLRAVRWQKLGIKVSGAISGELEQACIATLEPVSELLDITIDRRFLPDGKFVRKHERFDEGELVVDPDADDEPDEMPGGGIELWDVILEEINLALNPFPRSKDAPDEVPGEDLTVENEADGDDTHRPFADLNALINEKKPKK